MPEIPSTDSVGNIIQKGDTICFTLNMRKDQKPLVRAVIKDLKHSTSQSGGCPPVLYDWCFVEHIESPVVEWARKEKKLPRRVAADRVIKCY